MSALVMAVVLATAAGAAAAWPGLEAAAGASGGIAGAWRALVAGWSRSSALSGLVAALRAVELVGAVASLAIPIWLAGLAWNSGATVWATRPGGAGAGLATVIAGVSGLGLVGTMGLGWLTYVRTVVRPVTAVRRSGCSVAAAVGILISGTVLAAVMITADGSHAFAMWRWLVPTFGVLLMLRVRPGPRAWVVRMAATALCLVPIATAACVVFIVVTIASPGLIRLLDRLRWNPPAIAPMG